MAFKVPNLQNLHGFLTRRIMRRLCVLLCALVAFPLLKFYSNVDIEDFFRNSYDCPLEVYFMSPHIYFPPEVYKAYSSCEETKNFTPGIFRDLMDKKLLNSDAKVLFVGKGSKCAVATLHELGFSNVSGIEKYPYHSLWGETIYDISFSESSFDAVFSRALDRVSNPAPFVLEIERVLKPGAIGALLVRAHGTLIKTPLSSFLNSSNVIHVQNLNSSTLVVFKKRGDSFGSFENYRLPDECPSLMSNKPLIKYLEHHLERKLVGREVNFSYLSTLANISRRNQVVYIDIGAGEFINSSIANWFIPSYPRQSLPFNIYAVDHNPSVLASYVGKSGITFIYHPGLDENLVAVNPFPNRERRSPSNDKLDGFDFLSWIKDTLVEGDFVVMKMDVRGVGVKILHELFKSGGICLIDELFLSCTNNSNDQNETGGDCFHLLKALRSKGVYVHQWQRD